jgi:hypothetical protein
MNNTWELKNICSICGRSISAKKIIWARKYKEKHYNTICLECSGKEQKVFNETYSKGLMIF